VISERGVETVIVDTTVMAKAIAHPTGTRLYEKVRRRLVALAREAGLSLRQSHARLAPRLAGQVGRHAHARQFRRMQKGLRRLTGYTGRVLRDIQRQLGAVTDLGLRDRIEAEIAPALRLLRQKPKDKGKLYAPHEPAVDCIPKARRGSVTSLAPRSRWRPRTRRAASSACARCPAIPGTATPCARRWNRSRS